jgi:hypothetical protein
MDAGWNNFSLVEQQNIAGALNLSSPEQLPEISKLTSAQITVISEKVGASVADKVKTLSGEGTPSNPSLPDADLGDASALTLLMMELQEKLGKLQTETAKEGVKNQKLTLESASAERLDKIKESIEKMKESQKSGLLGKIFGWIGAIAGVIAAVAVSIVSFGAAAGVALTLAAIGLTMMIMQESGAMDKLMTAMFGDNEKAKMFFQIGLMVAMLVASITATVLSGGAAAGKLAGDATKMLGMIAKVADVSEDVARTAIQATSIGAQVVGAAGSVGGGAANINAAVKGYEATKISAESKELLAWLQLLQSQMEDQQEELQKAMDELSQGLSIGMDIIKSISESKSNIMQHFGA